MDFPAALEVKKLRSEGGANNYSPVPCWEATSVFTFGVFEF